MKLEASWAPSVAKPIGESFRVPSGGIRMMRPPKSLLPSVVLPPVTIGMTSPAASVVTPMTPGALDGHDDRRWSATGATGVTVTNRPDARSLTNRLPP